MLYPPIVEWPRRFYEMREGIDCPMCEEGRPDSTRDGLRFHAGKVSDAYLRRPGIQRGLSVVIWRGRHVAEPTELDRDESLRSWREVLLVGRALEDVFHPVKLNYDLLGNSVPHLHTHVVPRYADDPRPGWPFPFLDPEPDDVPEGLLRDDVRALGAAIRARDP